MESWLDWYATAVASTYGNRDLEYRPHSDGDVGDHFSRFAAEAVCFMKRPGAEHHESFQAELAWFGRCIAPFAGHYSEKPPLAVALEPGAVVDFELCDVDDKIRDYAEQALARHSTVYLDLPGRAYMLRGGVFQIRALFIWQCREGNRFCAVLTRPGSNHGWRIAWLEGHYARNERDRLFNQVWEMSSRDIADRYRPINFNRIDFGELAQVEKLAWASLFCWQHSLDCGVPAEELPLTRVDVREQPLGIVVDPPLLEERFSLFRIARIRNINPARIRAIRESISPAAGPTKCRHQVKEFWRWQACGKDREERRWTKVTGHMRGRGTPKTPMHVIQSANLPDVI